MALSLRSLFKGNRAVNRTGSNKEAEADISTSRLPDRITSSAQKLHTLTELMQTNTIVAVQPMGADGPYNSVILKVDPEQEYLLLDELKPESGHRELMDSKILEARARMNGALFFFRSKVEELGSHNGLAFYRVPLPEYILHKQRREHFRVDIPVKRYIPVQFITPEGLLMHGELTNISSGGCSLRVRNERRVPLTRGMVLPRATIDLPESEKIVVSIELCYVDDWELTTNLHLGGRFVEMEKPTRRIIDQFVFQLEREERKRRLD